MYLYTIKKKEQDERCMMTDMNINYTATRSTGDSIYCTVTPWKTIRHLSHECWMYNEEFLKLSHVYYNLTTLWAMVDRSDTICVKRYTRGRISIPTYLYSGACITGKRNVALMVSINVIRERRIKARSGDARRWNRPFRNRDKWYNLPEYRTLIRQ